MLLTLGPVGTAVSVVLWFTAVTLIIQPVLMSPWAAAGVYTELTIDSRPRAVVAMVFGMLVFVLAAYLIRDVSVELLERSPAFLEGVRRAARSSIQRSSCSC